MSRAAALADDRAADAEGLDRPRDRRRPARRGHLARPPGAAVRRPGEPRASAAAGDVAALLPPRGAVRRRRAGPSPQVLACVPERRYGASARRPHANGGLLLRDLPLPALEKYAVAVDKRGATLHEPTRVLGGLLADVMQATAERRDFRVVGPDETASNRLEALYDVTGKAWQAETYATDEHLARDGRVMEVLSEHLCQGWLEGYLLTGRHGLFSCYEAFAHIVDSMVNQHIKWLRTSRRIALAATHRLPQLPAHLARLAPGPQRLLAPGPGVRRPRPQQEPRSRPRLPPAGRQHPALGGRPRPAQPRLRQRRSSPASSPRFDWLTLDEARAHCARGAGSWEWAGTEDGTREPDVVLACAGDVPTQETLAAAGLLRRHAPELSVRVVNVVDMARLLPHEEHPHGMADFEYDALFTRDKPVIFAYHGYPWLIHRLAYRRVRTRQPARPRLQGGGHHDHPVRHGRPQRPRPVPPGHGRHRPRSRSGRARGRRCARRWPTCAPATTPGSASTAPTCPRSPTGPGAPDPGRHARRLIHRTCPHRNA